jgi:Ser/Thr protein kinase RdoA (MazF antagonist)
MAPGYLEMAQVYFDEHLPLLEAGTPTLVHGDLTLMNILVERGKITAILDFEYAMQAPSDYELWPLEAFCLYPNDWAEEDHEVCCTADYAGLFPLLQKHAPELFETPHLRERMNCYQLEATLGSYLAWRKDHLDSIPPERLAAKEFYMARITNFIFRHGVRMF